MPRNGSPDSGNSPQVNQLAVCTDRMSFAMINAKT
jgi:hypothetical protein